MAQADFAVIGGGPAGASAARRLAALGARVVLFERQPMPRAKPGGGVLSERARASLDLALPAALVDGEAVGVRIHFDSDTVESRLLRRIAVLVTRAKFDHFLVTAAETSGARVVWADVQSMNVQPDGVVLETSAGQFGAACALVCEGAAGRLSRLVRPPDAADQRIFSLAADIPVPDGDPYGDHAGVLDVYYGLLPGGYGWLFHHGSYYAVGVAGLESLMPRPQELFREFLAARGLALNGAPVRGHFIPFGGIRRRLCADRILLAGDAAGLADPFLGEGLGYAIRSGHLAAETALEAARCGDFSRGSLAVYERLCRETFEKDFRHALVLGRLIRRWPLPVIRAAAMKSGALERYLRVITGEWSYRRFVGWLMPWALWRWM